MLKNLPENIIRYVIEELPPYTGILIFKTDSESNIISYHGPHKEYLRDTPQIGEAIHNYIPALHSMIPPLISPMVLNKIQLHNSVYSDIHIMEGDENEYWVFLIDQSHEVEGIRDILQKMNEAKYQSETGKSISEQANSSIIDAFDFINLEVLGNGKADIIGNTPDWFNLLKNMSLKDDHFLFTETFPYLEVFLFEAEDFWDTNENGKLKSGIWSETLSNGNDLALVAYAINHNNSKHLLIRPLEEKIDNEQIALQMARDQKLAFEKLEKAEQKLRTLLDYKDKFVSIISHDLRSPVAAVLGISEMLINDETEMSKLDDFYKDMIHSIQEEMIRLLDYNDKLYHWSNLELGNFEIVKTETSLEKIIRTVERTADKKLKAKGITFSTNLEVDFKINVDMTLFLQVLNNLMANAIKFTPERGNISIDIVKNENLTLSVIDSGVGMPKEIAENIFDGFARNSTIGTGGEKGTGLGLGIVKKVIDSHGFDIHVESEIGKGSKFIITIK